MQSSVTIRLSALHARALLLDIEGTTTPIAFVYEILFPFARAHAAAYLTRSQDSAACRAALALLRDEAAIKEDFSPAKESDVAQDFSPAVILAYIEWLMDRDRKSPGLKSLQGLIWQDGYKSGELKGQVYPDVPPAFKRWRADGLDIYIYSSGSVLAQQMLFGSTEAGDLTESLKGYFDTAVGAKASSDSYRVISEQIHVAPGEVLFVSDVVAELDAARITGMHTALCVRGTDVASGSESHPVIRSFDEILD